MLKLNIVKIVAYFSNFCCITDTIYIYKILLIIKYHIMEAKRIKIFTLLRAGFKKT